MNDYIDTLYGNEKHRISSKNEAIKDYASKYPGIQRLLGELTIANYQEDGYYLSAISSLIFNIGGYDIENSISDLFAFISNYLVDDFYFTIEFTGSYYEAEHDNDHGKQDIDTLIHAAKHNAAYYRSLDAQRSRI